jgi:MATE family multidrug resistance protein
MRWRLSWHAEGGGREVLRLALPFVLSNSFLTLQIVIDRALLSRASSDAVAASMPAAVLYWTALTLLQNVANYATTFVAQYVGAGRPERAGPSVWQALYFSVFAGLAFLVLVPLAPLLFALGGHSPSVQAQEVTYFSRLCFAALPTCVVAAANSFFAGRGDSWRVLLNDAVGLGVNAVLAYALIFGHWGLPALGIAGAGWATVAGSGTSAVVALTSFFQPRYRALYQTLAGWRFDRALFLRLMRFGLPNGAQWMLDGLAFTAFLFLVGRLGDVELTATNIAFSINMVAFLPMFGMGQAVQVLVGQRLGQDRPDLAERSTWTGLWLSCAYMITVAELYVFVPGAFLYVFGNEDSKWELAAALVPVLLRFVAVYSLFDSMNLVFSFALRGAGDTRFVTVASLSLAWPLMVLPTWAAWRYGWGLYAAWAAASAYIIALAVMFLFRFRTGRWKRMRVIEAPPVLAAVPVAHEVSGEW